MYLGVYTIYFHDVLRIRITSYNVCYTKLLRERVPIEAFDEADFEPEEGMVIVAGEEPAVILEVTDADVALDFNHELAGETLQFTIKIVEKL